MTENPFIQELSEKLGSLLEQCHQEMEKTHSLKNKVLLQTSWEILGGLKKALEDSQNVNGDFAEEEDLHIVSPKGPEPWD